MKNRAILQLIEINRNSEWIDSDGSIDALTDFDPESRSFRTIPGDLYSEMEILNSAQKTTGDTGVALWRGIRVTVPFHITELCWAPYSVGDRVVFTGGDGENAIGEVIQEIIEIQVRVGKDAATVEYILSVDDGHGGSRGLSHLALCSLINMGGARVETERA